MQIKTNHSKMQIIRNTKKKKNPGHNGITESIWYYGNSGKTGTYFHKLKKKERTENMVVHLQSNGVLPGAE
jgi:hypothetical protein